MADNIFGNQQPLGQQPSSQQPSASQKRQPAMIVKIKQILDGNYIKEEGWISNYVLIDDGRKVARANIICTIISKEDDGKSITVDDGSSPITVRTFDDADVFSQLNAGDMITLIGRPREYGTQRYLIPEIMKKITDSSIVKLRQKELELLSRNVPKQKSDAAEAESPAYVQAYHAPRRESFEMKAELNAFGSSPAEEPDDGAEENIEDAPREKTPSEKLCEMIKKNDSGDGADVQELIDNSGIPDAEKIITRLISGGDIFMVRPGKVKVL